jgi:hypothetical protein
MRGLGFVAAGTLRERAGEAGGDCGVAAAGQNRRGKNQRWQFGQPESAAPGPAGGSAQERLLEAQLKVRQRTHRTRKDRPEMFESLEQGLGPCAGRRRLRTTESRTQRIQSPAQFAAQTIHRFQGEGQPCLFGGRLHREPGQQFHQPGPHAGGGERMSRQHVGPHQGKGASATATRPAIGTEYPLATDRAAVGLIGIVAAKNAMPVQRLALAAAGAALLFEGKSTSWSAAASRTKWKGRWNIRRCCPRPGGPSRTFATALGTAGLACPRSRKAGRTALDGTSAALRS